MSGEQNIYGGQTVYDVETDENKITKITRNDIYVKGKINLYDGGVYADGVKNIFIHKTSRITKKNGISNYMLMICVGNYAMNSEEKIFTPDSEYTADKYYDIRDVKFNTALLVNKEQYYLCEVVDSYKINCHLSTNNIKIIYIYRSMITENIQLPELYDNLTKYLHNSGKYDIIIFKQSHKTKSNTLSSHPTNHKKIRMITDDEKVLSPLFTKYSTDLSNDISPTETCFVETRTAYKHNKNQNYIIYAHTNIENIAGTKIESNFIHSKWDIFTNNDGYKSKFVDEITCKFIIADYNESDEQKKFIDCITQCCTEVGVTTIYLTDIECSECNEQTDSVGATIFAKCSKCYQKTNNVTTIKRNKNKVSFLG